MLKELYAMLYRIFVCLFLEAAKEMIYTEQRIIDIALNYRFHSHEFFTRSFTKRFGMSPAKYKKNGRLVNLYEKPGIIEREFKNVNKDVIVAFTYETLHDMKLPGREISDEMIDYFAAYPDTFLTS
jgi:AraC family transcriptional regulator